MLNCIGSHSNDKHELCIEKQDHQSGKEVQISLHYHISYSYLLLHKSEKLDRRKIDVFDL